MLRCHLPESLSVLLKLTSDIFTGAVCPKRDFTDEATHTFFFFTSTSLSANDQFNVEIYMKMQLLSSRCQTW